MTPAPSLPTLRAAFGSKLQENVRLSNYTTARLGGPADAFLVANSVGELAGMARQLWDLDMPFFLLGSGSNLLVSDAGVRGVVILNRARNIKIDAHHIPPTVYAETGANLGTVARQVALRGLSGLEWAATIPGTVGGAAYGNAGANGSDMKHVLALAEILHRDSGREEWSVKRLAYEYRTSALKQQPGRAVVLAARMNLTQSTPEAVKITMEQFSTRRRSTQPPGASLGSMFKNPPGDYAGRLIEAAGLKGARRGGAEISPVHANFFINHGDATSADVYQLIRLAQQTVAEKFSVQLQLEIELVGDWKAAEANHGR